MALKPPPMASSMMDVRLAITSYFDRIVSSVPGMKTVLLDASTLRYVSMCYTQSQIMDKGVFLVAPLVLAPPARTRTASIGGDVELVDVAPPPPAPREKMLHLKCIIVCRPVDESVREIVKELHAPNYGEYHIFFTNNIVQDVLNELARADRFNIVKQVQEYYIDYLAVNRDVFDLDLDNYLKLSRNRGRWNASAEYEKTFKRSVRGLIAVLLALRQKPAIRATAQSELAQMFAREVKHEMDRNKELFDFGAMAGGGSSGETLLLILDRRDDPVTPLLNQWTYQAMVHELIGIHDNIVDLRSVDGVGHRKPTEAGKKQEDVRFVLADNQDDFYQANMYKDWGAVADNTKHMLDTYKARHNSNMSLKTVEDMQRFVDAFPDFKKLANNATKHVAIVGELSKLIEYYHLLDVSALEQDLACVSDHSNHVEKIKAMIDNDRIPFVCKRNLVLLYALRYEALASNRTVELQRMLSERARQHHHQQPGGDAAVMTPESMALVDYLLSYAGMAKRSTQTDLFGGGSGSSGGGGLVGGHQDLLMKMGFRPSSVVENIFTQHKPLLARILDEAKAGKLSDAKYPKVSSGTLAATAPAPAPGAFVPIHKDVIVFMVGGTTYEEAAVVARINAEASKMPSGVAFRVVLGGTRIHNSRSFLRELAGLGQALASQT